MLRAPAKFKQCKSAFVTRFKLVTGPSENEKNEKKKSFACP